MDSTYIDNAVTAHLLAADRLAPGSPLAGRAYFISQGDPWPLWLLINGILRAAGLPPVTRSVPAAVARLAGALMEGVHRTFRLPGEPMMTRFLVQQLSTSHWYNIEAARRDLGYRPTVSIDGGLRRLGRWFDESS